MRKTFINFVMLMLLAVSASAQSYLSAGFTAGGNNLKFKDTARVEEGDGNYVVYQKGSVIDKYTFFGGFTEAQKTFQFSPRFGLNVRGLVELTTDPKNTGMERDGSRLHARPELEALVKVVGELSALVNSGVGFTHISNKEYSENGLNPHVGVGLSYRNKYNFVAQRLFEDTYDNGNATKGYRFRADALHPFTGKWGVKFGFEYTRYTGNIPGLEDTYSAYPCHCVRTDGTALTFRVGTARLFN